METKPFENATKTLIAPTMIIVVTEDKKCDFGLDCVVVTTTLLDEGAGIRTACFTTSSGIFRVELKL